MHDPAVKEPAHYSVVYGTNVQHAPPKSAVRVEQEQDGLAVDTGALRFFISRAHFGFMENVQLRGGQVVQREPISAEIVEADGRTWRALDLPVAKLEVEQPGPL